MGRTDHHHHHCVLSRVAGSLLLGSCTLCAVLVVSFVRDFSILLAIFFRCSGFWLKMSSFVAIDVGSWWISGHSSRMCSWVSCASLHSLQVLSLCIPRKLFFTSIILVRALNIMLHSLLVSFLIYSAETPGYQSGVFSFRNLTLDFSFPSLSILSWKACLIFLVIVVFTFLLLPFRSLVSILYVSRVFTVFSFQLFFLPRSGLFCS